MYAISGDLQFTVIDPDEKQSTIFVANVNSDSGEPLGKGYLISVTTSGLLNYTITPSDNALIVSSLDSSFSADVAFVSADGENRNIFQAEDIPIENGQTAVFSITNWYMLNSTNQSSVHLEYSENNDSGTTKFDLVNGQSGLASAGQNWLFAMLLTTAGIIAVICAVVLIISKKRKRPKW